MRMKNITAAFSLFYVRLSDIVGGKSGGKNASHIFIFCGIM